LLTVADALKLIILAICKNGKRQPEVICFVRTAY